MAETMQESMVHKTVLDNGLTVLSEHIPGLHSVSVGVWIKSGSRQENRDNNGIAHFLEHMVFKGTENRSALQIASALEDLGGSLNAYTGKETTVFYAHTLDKHLSESVDILSDMVCRPLFRKEDIETERRVVLEEISAVKDTPEEYIFDLFQEKLFANHPLGYPVLGRTETVAQFDRDMVLDFWQTFYRPANMIFCAAGNVNHRQFVDLVKTHFNLPAGSADLTSDLPAEIVPFKHSVRQGVYQTHICAGGPALAYLSPQRYDLLALNTYLGGGMSSRLFQVIREKHGLAYSVYSGIDFFRDTGMISFYIGTDPKNEKRAVHLLTEEIERIRTNALPEETIGRIREQLKGSFLLGLESANRRMTRLAKNYVYYDRQISVKEVLQRIDAINSDSVLELAQKLFNMETLSIITINPSGNH
ncbi:MAG TPA: insulinase family protein [Caldithrix abyssi]|uniref:Insulinase family protein n=1 Tax=Caldithrix abyssi TaxID=187145 RepID=A0A7V4TZ43_CALAY|nr:insulinase family protein [Caldithrix abyssi]